MKYFFLKFSKKTFLSLFLGMGLLLGSQEMKAVVYTTIADGPWTTLGTWDINGIPPAGTTTSDVININHIVTRTLSANFTVGALNISSVGGLTVSQDATARSFTIGILTPGSTIAGPLLFDASVTGTKTFGKVTVTASGSVIETTKVSISMNNSANGVLTNYGTVTTGSLAMSGNGGNLTKIDNYGTINCTGFSSQTLGTFTNFSTGTFNYTGGTFPTGMNFIASDVGNTVNYGSSSSQVIRTPTSGAYSNLILSGTGTKTFPQSADVTVGNLTIGTGVILRVTSASVSSVTIDTGGSGYASAPTVTFANPPAGGTLAAGSAIVTSSAVTSVLITNPGSGYTTAPAITFGSGTATATANITALPTAYKFTVTGTTTNNGTLDFVTIAGTGDKTFATFNNPGAITSTATANYIFNTADYSSAVSQTILPGTYTNLTLSNVAGSKNIASATTVTIAAGGLATVNNGVSFTNSGDLILKSTASGTASLLSDTSVANVTQERYLSSNQRGWRLLSNPVATKLFSALATASNITLGSGFTGEYVPASNTWTSNTTDVNMTTQQAYKVFITGLTGEAPTYATGPSNVTLVNKGTATNTAPAGIVTTAGQFYLVANPYTAPVSLSSIVTASTGLSNSVTYYNPTIGSNGTTDLIVKKGGYDLAVAVSGAAGSATDVVIPPMGAIFVQASSAGSINIPKTAIFTGTPLQTGTYNHKTAQTKVASTNALKVEVSSDGVYYDALALQFKAVGDAGSNIDFGKLPNSILDAYSIAGSNKMAVSELELAAQTIPLGITSTIEKNYTFKVVENSIPAGYEAVLVDNVLNTSTVLTAGTNYNFAIDSTPASQGDARFAINLKTAGSLGVKANELDASIQVYPNPSRGEFNITNTLNQNEDATIEISGLNGQVIHTQKLNSGTTTIQTKSWSAGVYILKASNNGTQTTKKLIIQ